MDSQERYLKHKTAIQKRWEPILKEVLLQEEPGKKISILKKAKQQAAKVIQDPEEQLSFLEYLDNQLKWHEGALLKQNGSTGVSQVDQSIETLNTDENTQEAQNTWKPVEKINWKGTETQLVLLVDLLTQEALLKSDRKWKTIEEHFLVQGKPTRSKNLSQSLENTLAGKTKDEKTLKEIISEVKKLED